MLWDTGIPYRLRELAWNQVNFEATITVKIDRYSLREIRVPTPRNIVDEFTRRVWELTEKYLKDYNELVQSIKTIVFEDLKEYIHVL